MNEMSHLPHDQPLDDTWPAGDPALAGFADDLGIIAAGPAPEPRPGLIAVMRQGPFVPVASAPGRRKLLGKTLLGSLAAKLAFGVGAAAASVTAAGAVGVLPDPAQHAVASVVGAATPFVLPDPSSVRVSRDVSDPASTTMTTLAGTPDDDAADSEAGDDQAGDDGTTRASNHGACVSAVAKADTGSGSHGKTVSSVARSDCGKTSTPTTVVSPTTSTTAAGSSTTSTSVATTSTSDDDPRDANGGPGNSKGNGNRGNRGPGNRDRN